MRTSNFVSVTGNLGGVVELKDSGSGREVAKLSLAETVSRPNPNTGVYEPVHTNWIPVTAFAGLARRAAKALKKGDRITVLGSLKTSSYEKDGENRRGFEVIAHSIEKAQFLARADAGPPDSSPDSPSFDDFQSESLISDVGDGKAGGR
jgi:single stranded DNA-binding protein